MIRLPTAEEEVERLTQVLDDIAHSFSNDPDFLRNMAASAIFENGDGCDISDTINSLAALLEIEYTLRKATVVSVFLIIRFSTLCLFELWYKLQNSLEIGVYDAYS